MRSAPREKVWLSGGKDFVFHGGKPGSFVSLQSTLTRPGVFDVYAIHTQSPRSGQFRLALNGREFPGAFDGYARSEKICEPAYYGKCPIGSGKVTARFTIVGKTAVSGGFDFGIDCLLLRRDRVLEERNRAAARNYLKAGASNFQRKRFKDAEANFTAAISLVPGDPTTLEWRAHARLALGLLEEAKQDIDAALELSPENPRLSELKKRVGSEKNRQGGM